MPWGQYIKFGRVAIELKVDSLEGQDGRTDRQTEGQVYGAMNKYHVMIKTIHLEELRVEILSHLRLCLLPHPSPLSKLSACHKHNTKSSSSSSPSHVHLFAEINP